MLSRRDYAADFRGLFKVYVQGVLLVFFLPNTYMKSLFCRTTTRLLPIKLRSRDVRRPRYCPPATFHVQLLWTLCLMRWISHTVLRRYGCISSRTMTLYTKEGQAPWGIGWSRSDSGWGRGRRSTWRPTNMVIVNLKYIGWIRVQNSFEMKWAGTKLRFEFGRASLTLWSAQNLLTLRIFFWFFDKEIRLRNLCSGTHSYQ